MDADDEGSTKLLEWARAIGMPLATLLITVFGGYYLTSLTNDRETREGNDRLYAELFTQREQSDALIRKDMFGVVLKEFLTDAKPGTLSTKVLQLELLANNFSQSLDLAPLFKDVARRLAQDTGLPSKENAALRRRLDSTASNLIFRQVESLARHGYTKREQVALRDWRKSYGKPVISGAIARSLLVPTAAGSEQIRFWVEVIDVALERREVDVRLRVDFPGIVDDLDRHFWVGQYDFPMLDNTQLRDGLRASIVITEFLVPEERQDREANSYVVLQLVVFPATSASFKERQDYDDILLDMLRSKGNPSLRGRQP
ncbi:MAG TPA: hypothetical protein VE034_03835 [Burkholderiales bacterium]|nr:hypothetical protein [Burkholderiales bacterium]